MSTSAPSTQAARSDTAIRPFCIHVPDEDVADLRRRIAAARWPSQELVADRSQGVQLATIQELARYWAADYDFGRVDPDKQGEQRDSRGNNEPTGKPAVRA